MRICFNGGGRAVRLRLYMKTEGRGGGGGGSRQVK